MINLINVPSQITSTPKKRRIYISPSLLYLDPKTVTERIIIILVQCSVTSNPECTEEETVEAVWNSGAIKKGGCLHIKDTDREAILAKV